MVRGEERQFDEIIDHLLEYTQSIKVSLLLFIHRIENEADLMDWPQILNNFTSICGQINTLMRYTREKSQIIEKRVVLPLLLSPERDEELSKLTEGRVHVVNHEMVPDYLRTKPDPEIEEFEKNLQIKASTISPEAAVKQVNAMTKLVDNILNLIKANSARADSEMSRQAMKPSYVPSETNDLIMAVSSGRGLLSAMGGHRMAPMDSSMVPKMDSSRQQGSQKQNVKAPELKTNIRAGP